MGYFKNQQLDIIEMFNDGASIEQIAMALKVPVEEVRIALDDFESDYDDSMDGDFDSAMASAGFGTDEDYGYYGDE